MQTMRERLGRGSVGNTASNDAQDDKVHALALAANPAREVLDLGKIEQEAEQARKGDRQARSQSDERSARDAVAAVEIAVDQHGEVMLIQRDPYTRIDAVDSQAAKDALMLMVAEKTGKAPSSQLLERELGPIKARARKQAERVQVWNRVAENAAGYVLDLGDSGGRAVFINTEGTWRTDRNQDTYFVRGGSYGRLPEPIRPAGLAEAFFFLRGWLVGWGMSEDKASLLMAALVNMLRPGVTQLVLQIHGPAGAAKTTLQAQLAGLIDPTPSGERPTTKINEADIAAMSRNIYALCADNVSKLGADEQDLVCRIATGTVLAFRRLYTQGEVYQAKVQAPLIITALVPVIKAPDAQSRTLSIPLAPRLVHRSSVDIRREYEDAKPELLGALVELFAATVSKLPVVKRQRQWRGRLVDYQQLGEALFQAIGREPGSFMQVFDHDRENMARESAQGDPFTAALLAVLEDLAGLAEPADKSPPLREWARGPKPKGYAATVLPNGKTHIGVRLATALELFRNKALLREFANDDGWMPRKERQLSEAIVRATPTLQDLGWTAKCSDSGGTKIWAFVR